VRSHRCIGTPEADRDGKYCIVRSTPSSASPVALNEPAHTRFEAEHPTPDRPECRRGERCGRPGNFCADRRELPRYASRQRCTCIGSVAPSISLHRSLLDKQPSCDTATAPGRHQQPSRDKVTSITTSSFATDTAADERQQCRNAATSGSAVGVPSPSRLSASGCADGAGCCHATSVLSCVLSAH